MKRKNLIAIRKVKKKNLLIKNLKFRKLYTKFKTIIFKNIKRKSFALAVSGGQTVCVWLILVKFMLLSLRIKYTP